MANFMDVMARRTVAIDEQLNQIAQRQIQQNREKMRSIIKTVVFCGHNAVALRGARDDNPDDETLQGNFQALLAFRVDSGDKTLQEHFENAPRNGTYRSKTVQNEIINTVGSYITSKISAEIIESKLFSVVADEAADISNKEQLSLVLRFVNSSQQIREEFVGFYHCEAGTSGVALKDMILKAVTDLGLSMANCRGQSYDGAGNMAGKYNGVSTLIQSQFSKAIYVHCMNHRLNLCVADTCSEYLVKDMMSVVRSLSSFFSGSPKRQQHLKEKVKSLLPASKHEILINVCETRWIARLDGLDRIIELLLPVVYTLEDIAHNRKGGDEEPGSGDWNQKSKVAAIKMLPSITFEFVVTLVIVSYILDLTRAATVKLQRKEMDLLKAHSEISSLKRALKDLRSNIDREHNKLYQEAVELAATIGLDPCKPRIIPVQAHRNNNPSDSIEQHYRVNLSVIFLDHVLNQLETRFPPEAYICYKGFSIVPTVMLANPSTWRNSVTLFCQHYSNDIPNIIGLPAELTLWQRRWEEKVAEVGIDKLPDKVSKTLTSVDPVAFPNIFTVLKLLATIPVTSCSCERSISSLRLLKNYLRNTTGQERLNGLTLMHAHKAIPLDYDKIIDMFATLHPRRMRMVHILCSDD